MSNWVGYAVSVNCGETLGCYQGTILEADGMTITLTKAFRNGFPYPKSQVTLNAADIKDLRIIEERSERAKTHSTVAVPAGRKSRTTVCETLQANPTNTGNQVSSNNANNNVKTINSHKTNQAVPPAPTRSKPVEILASRNKNNNHTGSYGSGSTPKSRGNAFGGRGESTGIPGPPGQPAAPHDKLRRRNEACFGDAADPALEDDFDFEGNLALFDKRAVWASMRNSKPDLVRTADERKYRHDENVLGGARAGVALRVPPELRGPVDYVTDEGARVPTVTPALRRQLWQALQRHGLLDFALTIVARATCDVALRLVGGGRRLEARNAHQAPIVVCVSGAHRGGACGLAAARLLASRGARVCALLAGAAPGCAPLQRELAALALDAVPVHAQPAALPPAPDLVLLALYDPLLDNRLDDCEAACRWARGRALALAVEPAGGGWAGAEARASVLGLAAVALAPALGRVYLADVAAPARLYAECGLAYRAPFGAAPVLALHPAEAEAEAAAALAAEADGAARTPTR